MQFVICISDNKLGKKTLLLAQFLHKVDLNEGEGTTFLDLTFTAATNYAR